MENRSRRYEEVGLEGGSRAARGTGESHACGAQREPDRNPLGVVALGAFGPMPGSFKRFLRPTRAVTKALRPRGIWRRATLLWCSA
ncbi:hypothetical protein IG193_08810 [Infirmifilum lucidum]|uniref:Uncharacterized protein n=1 Tax=Infirmifilum lucidum TaxID=2776706 RepID=A0A7L9FGA2_9CREN|nr:hypothetical protein [Infirmifilum lucidum]QOJ78830.1 hypothetical protein IG193_08810 [Infirmifilum lucidum]